MEEGKLAKWLVKEGQTIKPGDIIAEIETDKATMEVEAVDEGKVSKLLISEGTEGVKVNTPIAVLLAEGEKDGAPTVAKQPSPPAKGQASRAPAAAPSRFGTASPPRHAEGVSSTRRGEGLGVGGTTSRRDSPLPSPSPPGGRAHRRRARQRMATGASSPRRWRDGWRRRRDSIWQRLPAAGRMGASSSAISTLPSRTAAAQPRAGTAVARTRGDGARRAADARRQDPRALREGLLRDPRRTTACARSSPSA